MFPVLCQAQPFCWKGTEVWNDYVPWCWSGAIMGKTRWGFTSCREHFAFQGVFSAAQRSARDLISSQLPVALKLILSSWDFSVSAAVLSPERQKRSANGICVFHSFPVWASVMPLDRALQLPLPCIRVSPSPFSGAHCSDSLCTGTASKEGWTNSSKVMAGDNERVIQWYLWSINQYIKIYQDLPCVPLPKADGSSCLYFCKTSSVITVGLFHPWQVYESLWYCDASKVKPKRDHHCSI